MSTAKTTIDDNIVKDFLEKRGVSVNSIERIEGGEISQAYLFDLRGEKRVLRINARTDEGFLKDKFAADNFASRELPIPQIETVGEITKGMYFAISERAIGKMLYNIQKDDIDKVMPAIMTVVDAIHATAPTDNGYGWLRVDGSGKFDSWPEALDKMREAEDDYKLASVPFFEKDLHETLTAEIIGYYKYCSTDRFLVHGDLSGNMLCDEGKITGVIDWHSSMYGDPLWDVAWLDFWGEWHNYAKAFRQHYEDKKLTNLLENFDERLICYKLIIGANSMCFFAKSDQLDKYNYAKKIVADITR